MFYVSSCYFFFKETFMLADEKIKSFLYSAECKSVKNIYQNFPNTEKNVLNYHIKKYRNDLLSDYDGSGEPKDDGSGELKKNPIAVVKPAKQRERVKEWILENYVSDNKTLYSQFTSLKEVTLRGYRKEVADFLHEELSYLFLLNNDDWPGNEKKLDDFLIYILKNPAASELSLRKHFSDVDIAVIRDFRGRIFSAIDEYRGLETVHYNNAQSTSDVVEKIDNSGDDIQQNALRRNTDNAKNLDLESLKKKAETIKQSHEIDTITNNQLNKIKSLEKEISLLKKHISNIEKQIPDRVKTAIEQVLLEKMSSIGLGIVGKVIEKHIGSLGKINFNIDLGSDK